MNSPEKKNILVCDDENGVRESLKLILDDDYRLEFTQNGLEALEKMKSFAPALVLLDIKMPKIHGLEILKRMKNLHPEVPVIIVTGYQSAEVAQEALKSGAADYITKPFYSKKILDSVARCLKSPVKEPSVS